jgi:hypothetical protein
MKLLNSTISILLLFMALPSLAKQHAMVVGINDYLHLKPIHETISGQHSDLAGAVNDAKLISSALRKINVDLPQSRILLDDRATVANFIKGFREILQNAKREDTIIITFAGHGGREIEVSEPIDEEDGQDETLMFHEFDPSNPRIGRLNDDQLRELLIEAKDYNVILVLDSCHSGGLERSINRKFVGVSRNGGRWPISIEPLEDELIPSGGDRGNTLAHVTKILATETDELLVLETELDEQVHGAVSYYFAKGVSGAADGDGNDLISRRELSNYIESQVLAKMNQNQRPRLLPRGDDSVVFDLSISQQIPPVDELDLEGKNAEDRKLISVFVPEGEKNFNLGLEAVYKDRNADLTFDQVKGGWDVYNHTGDKIYFLHVDDEFSDEPQKIIARTKFLKAFSSFFRSDLNPGEIIASQSAALQKIGKRVGFQFVPPNDKLVHLTAFNLAGNGELQYLHPNSTNPHPLSYDGLKVLFEVVQPTGVDQLVAVYCASQPIELREFLKKRDGGYAPNPSDFEGHLKQSDCQVARIGLYTTD